MPAEEMGSRAPPQPPDVASRMVLICAFGFLAFVAVSMAGLMLYMRWLVPSDSLRATTKPFPEPTLQISPQGDLDRFKVEQRKALTGYGWVDRTGGIAHVPIEDAMRDVAGRGDAAYEPFGLQPVVPAPGSRGGVRP